MAAPTSDPAVLHQQVMSAQSAGSRLPGEDHGPDYGNMPPGHEQVVGPAEPRLNGVTPETAATSVQELPATGLERGLQGDSGSAGVPREMVQAEVAKQLDGAMTEVYQNMIARISTERQRTEDAEREAQQLRLQLELMEQRMSGQMFEPPPMPTPAETSEPPSLLSRVNFREVDHQRKAVDVGFYKQAHPPKGIAPPPVPMVASSSLGANERVLTAMAKGIETLLQNQSSKGERPETVKPGITELPILPPYTPETGSIDLINWVTHITPIMEDLSDSSSLWWSSMLKQVMEWYAKYSVAAPLERVQMLPVGSAISTKPEWARVERRATAMMLSAIPGTLKEEVIAVGGVNTVNLLAKLFSTYQPGNRQEKALVLTNLEKPTECQDAASAVEALRKWALWRRRASAIGITEPDASVLLQGLDRICQGQRYKWMYALQTVELLDSFNIYKLNWNSRQGVEQLAVPTTTVNPPPPPPKGQSTQCRFFASEKGTLSYTIVGSVKYWFVTYYQVLHEVKCMEAFQPLVSAVEKWSSMWSTAPVKRAALMDSGATHPLRRPHDEKEWLEAVNVNVALAGEARTTMKQNSAGTLLSGDELSQVIVPLGRVIDSLGYRLRWSSTECCLERGDELLPLRIVRGCPEVDEATAHRLIQELETRQVPRLHEATMESVRILRNVEVSWWSCLVDYVTNGNVESGKEALMRAMFFGEEEEIDEGIYMVAYVNVGSLLAQGGFATTWTLGPPPQSLKLTPVIVQGFLVERRRGASMDSVDWMCDGKAQRYCDEMNLPDPMFQEEQAIEIVNGLTGIVYGAAGRVRLAKMSRDASWRLHIMRNHQPFRRDCALCVRNAATGRQHRATLHPTGYTLSVDVAGPLKGFGKSPDGKYFKYFVIGAFRIPLLDGGVTYDEELRGHPIPEEPELDDDPVLSDEDNADELLEEEEDVPPIAQERRDEEEWKKLRDKFKAPLMTETLYFCVPVNSKKSLHVLPALQQMVIDIRGLGYPVTRIHSDRGGELRSNAIKRWVLSQGILRTTSTGSEPAENGVAEAGVRFLKRRGPGPAHLNTSEKDLELNHHHRLVWVVVGRPRGKSPGVRMKAMRLEGDYEDMVEALGDDYGEGEADPVYQEEIMMRVLKAQEKQAVEAVAVELLNAGDFSREACQRLLRALGGFHTRWKTPRATVGQGMILGAYVRGGSFGITTYGRELPNTLKFLNKFLHIRLQYVMPGSTCTWTTLALQRANAIPAHRDVHNQRGARNYVMEIADETLEGLWVEGAEGAQPVEGGDGVMQPHELQLEDGQVLRGRLHSIEEPVAFDPRARHALVNEAGMKWVLSAYTPSGVHQLLQADVDYLFQHGFPVTGTGVALPTVRAIQRVAYGTGASWETRPMSDASLVQPEFVTLSGSRVAGAQEEVDASIGYEGDEDGDEAAGDWELFVESSEDSCVVEEDVDYQDTQQPRLCRLCSSEDPGCERDLLQRVYEGHLQSDECSEHIQEAMAANLEEWEVYFPMIAKVEPEFTENIEALIDGLEEPLRHTHNVNPREVRASVEKWRASIEKELKVVEKGFERVTVDEIKNYKRTHQVQELPAKLVYTLKPPSDEAVPGTEAAKCKRKSRIVCCGNFNDQDPGDVFASGAAAESLRCTLVLAALRRWVAGGLDITGAFMLTPLPRDKTLIVITPPNILICLGLASPQERWVLTRAMYGLRQAPHLWSEFRDNVIKGMQFELHGSKWKFRQGGAEPNIWYLFQEDASTKVPAGVLLIYVDDLLLLGPPDLVNAMASSIQSTWKTSTLELVEPCRGIRFLGCEIETNEARDAYWIHQKPYVVELLRHHNIPSTARSPIPCPKDMLSLQIEEDEDKGDEHDLRQAQKLCGELLWLSQRSRPDIAFPVSIMGSLLTRAAPRSIAIGQRLLSYLQRTMGMALELRPTEGGFEAWSDCSFAPNGSKPHSGMTITWDKAVISWRSGRQPFTCLSTAEGELVAAIETLTLSMSMKAIVDEFGVPLPATTLCIDNQAALVLANPSSTASWRTRHLRIRSSFLREKVDQGEVKLLYVPGKIQLADLLTKGFPRQRLEELCGLWGLVDMFEAASQMKLVKVMVMMTMLVQTARGSLITKDPIPLETSWELYVVLALVVVAVISFWECGWSVWYTLSGQETPAQMRKSRRVKRMKDAIEEEIQTQMASRGNESTNTMLASAPIASSSTESAASSSTGPTGSTSTRPTASRTAMTRQPSSSPTTPPRNYITGGSGMQVETRSTALARGRTVYRADQKDKACQTEAWMIPSPRPLIQYVDREVPVPIAEASGWTRPIWVSEHGDHFHTLDYCWGLRNSKHKRRLLYCTLCRDNFGRSLYPDRG
ncbi:unnamed protein product [Symbiodinium sp. KB8]|nr:unnamed protein product [Symbiodinium sp. KB8]